MKIVSLAVLRISLGLLMVIWGTDKLINPTHGVRVAKGFYFGMGAMPEVMPVLGGLQVLLGVLVIAGLARRQAYIALAAITGMTLIGVWRSILDPLGLYLKGQVLFFPSLIIFAGVLVLLAFRDDDRFALDARRATR